MMRPDFDDRAILALFMEGRAYGRLGLRQALPAPAPVLDRCRMQARKQIEKQSGVAGFRVVRAARGQTVRACDRAALWRAMGFEPDTIKGQVM